MNHNDIQTKQDIYDAIIFEDWLAGTQAILFDESNLRGTMLNRYFKLSKIGVCQTCDIV